MESHSLTIENGLDDWYRWRTIKKRESRSCEINNWQDEWPVKNKRVILSISEMNKTNYRYRKKSIFGRHVWIRIISSTEMESQSFEIENEADKCEVQK